MIRTLLVAPLILLAAACSGPAKPTVEVRDAWARATAPGQSSGAIYATIVSDADDALIGASTDRAGMAMIHSSDNVGGVARMRMLDQVELPAGEDVALAPGGTHIMLEGLTSPLVAGDKLSLDLQFTKAGTRKVDVTVVAAGGR